MRIRFRTGAGGDTDVIPFEGTAFTPTTFVEIEYVWLILPIALISLTFIFLLATICKSQRLGSRVWKSSTLAILRGLHKDLHNELGSLSSITEMEEKAESIKVKFSMKGREAEDKAEYQLVEEKSEKK